MPRAVWRLLARAAGGTVHWTRLREESLCAANVSAAYFCHGTLRDARRYPWKLCCGDIRANLRELAALPEAPRGSLVAQQIYDILQRKHFPFEAVVEAVRLMSLCPWAARRPPA